MASCSSFGGVGHENKTQTWERHGIFRVVIMTMTDGLASSAVAEASLLLGGGIRMRGGGGGGGGGTRRRRRVASV